MTAARSAQLAQRFPTPDAIPSEQRLAASVHQRTSLVGGRMLEWPWPKTVLSPICTRDPASGDVSQSRSAATR